MWKLNMDFYDINRTVNKTAFKARSNISRFWLYGAKMVISIMLEHVPDSNTLKLANGTHYSHVN